METQGFGKRILYFSLSKILVGLVVCVGVVALGQQLAEGVLRLTTMREDARELIAGLVVALLAIAAYIGLYRFYEKRPITELATKGSGRHLALGMLLGAGLQALTILVIYLSGSYIVESVNPVSYLIPPLTMAFTSAIVEEILLRGIIFRIPEEKLGSYLSLAISAIIVGLLHLANPNSSLIAGIGLAIQAGLLLGAAYIYARNLWFPIAIHFAWNFTETAIFGANVSGNELSKTWISSEIAGPEWLTGGAFGPEGSIHATLFCLIATIILLVLSHRAGRIVSPYWHVVSDEVIKPG